MGKRSEGGSAIFHFLTVTPAITQTQRQPTGRWWKQRLAKVIGNTLALKINTKTKQPATGSERGCESDNLVSHPLLRADSFPDLYLFTHQAPGSGCADPIESEKEAVLYPPVEETPWEPCWQRGPRCGRGGCWHVSLFSFVWISPRRHLGKCCLLSGCPGH